MSRHTHTGLSVSTAVKVVLGGFLFFLLVMPPFDAPAQAQQFGYYNGTTFTPTSNTDPSINAYLPAPDFVGILSITMTVDDFGLYYDDDPVTTNPPKQVTVWEFTITPPPDGSRHRVPAGQFWRTELLPERLLRRGIPVLFNQWLPRFSFLRL